MSSWSLPRRALAATAGIVALGTATTSSAQEPAEPTAVEPDGESTGKWVFVGVGAGILALTHLTAVGVAAEFDFHDEGHWLIAPVVGPWIYLGERQGCAETEGVEAGFCSVGDVFLVFLVAADGIIQLAGATVMTIGLTMPARREPDGWSIRPTVAPARGGVAPGVSGTF